MGFASTAKTVVISIVIFMLIVISCDAGVRRYSNVISNSVEARLNELFRNHMDEFVKSAYVGVAKYAHEIVENKINPAVLSMEEYVKRIEKIENKETCKCVIEQHLDEIEMFTLL
jgi:hypothetical protein